MSRGSGKWFIRVWRAKDRSGKAGGEDGGAFSDDLRLQIFPESPSGALGVLKKSTRGGVTMENETPRAGAGGNVEGPVAAVSQN